MTQKTPNNVTPFKRSTPGRMSPKLRKAIDLRVTRGMTILDACKEAGMSEAGYHKAMKRPEVQTYLQRRQERFVAEVESMKAIYKARAFEVALELMENAKSESVRARMAEFLASDGEASSGVTVNTQVNLPGGYEYIPPGAKVVDVEQPESGEAPHKGDKSA